MMYKVLYIDDEPDMVEVLKPLLEATGLEVHATTSIVEALEVFERHEFHVVLLDICMPPAPGMDPEAVQYGRETGVEVARRLKMVRPEVPIVALTVVRDEEIKEHMRLAGVGSIINKPKDVAVIENELARAIAGGKRQTEL
jgi:CheY-like chemotaxis protein